LVGQIGQMDLKLLAGGLKIEDGRHVSSSSPRMAARRP
jgi:hypothetical protein